MNETTATTPTAPATPVAPAAVTAQTTSSSQDLKELASALCKVQATMQPIARSADNPFFSSRYSDLSAVWEGIRKPLTDNGFCVIQAADVDESLVIVTTTLLHSSGQFVKSRIRMRPVKSDPQGIGSAITYARRYALSAIVGACSEGEDDDGNAASRAQGGSPEGQRPPRRNQPAQRQQTPRQPDMPNEPWNKPPDPAQATQQASDFDTPPCPVCHGPMKDNVAEHRKATKAGKKSPAWRCATSAWDAKERKRTGCDGAYWSEKEAQEAWDKLKAERLQKQANQGDDPLAPFEKIGKEEEARIKKVVKELGFTAAQWKERLKPYKVEHGADLRKGDAVKLCVELENELAQKRAAKPAEPPKAKEGPKCCPSESCKSDDITLGKKPFTYQCKKCGLEFESDK